MATNSSDLPPKDARTSKAQALGHSLEGCPADLEQSKAVLTLEPPHSHTIPNTENRNPTERPQSNERYASSETAKYGNDKYDREDLHSSYVFLLEMSFDEVKEVLLKFGIDQGGPKGYCVAKIMAFLYERVVEKNVATVERLLGSTARWGFVDFMEMCDVFHFEKPKPSKDLLVRICNATKSSKEAKALLQLAPELAQAGRRKRKNIGSVAKRTSPRSKRQKKSARCGSHGSSARLQNPESSVEQNVDEIREDGSATRSLKENANAVSVSRGEGEHAPENEEKDSPSAARGQSLDTTRLPNMPSFSNSEFARLMYLLLEDPECSAAYRLAEQPLSRAELDKGKKRIRGPWIKVIAKRFNDPLIKPKSQHAEHGDINTMADPSLPPKVERTGKFLRTRWNAFRKVCTRNFHKYGQATGERSSFAKWLRRKGAVDPKSTIGQRMIIASILTRIGTANADWGSIGLCMRAMDPKMNDCYESGLGPKYDAHAVSVSPNRTENEDGRRSLFLNCIRYTSIFSSRERSLLTMLR